MDTNKGLNLVVQAKMPKQKGCANRKKGDVCRRKGEVNGVGQRETGNCGNQPVIAGQ